MQWLKWHLYKRMEVKMINWLKKKLLKSIIKDITKKMPKYKEEALLFVEKHKDEVIDKVTEAIKNIVEAELAKHLNKGQ